MTRPETLPRAGEIPFKEWVMKQAQKFGTGYYQIYRHLKRHPDQMPKIRRANRKVIFVKE